MGQKQKTEKKIKRRKRDRKLVITMAKLRMAHASTYGARKPPGPISVLLPFEYKFICELNSDSINCKIKENFFDIQLVLIKFTLSK